MIAKVKNVFMLNVKETFMTRSEFIRLSGWSLMLGALTFLLFILLELLANDVYTPYGPMGTYAGFGFLVSVWVTPILFGVGLLGMRARYGDQVGGVAKNVLLIGAVSGPLINIIGITVPQIGGWSWLLPFTGNAVLLACLSIFGISALSAKPLTRWNSLPFIAGVWYPVITILMLILEFMGGLQTPLATPAFIFVPLQCVLLILLGYRLQAEVPQETPVTA
jgi:hypothetical protein